MNKREFVSFVPKENYVDPVAASHVNLLQQVAEILQRRAHKKETDIFLLRALSALEYRQECNTLWVELFPESSQPDWTLDTGLEWCQDEMGLRFLPSAPQQTAEAVTQVYTTTQPPLQNVLFLTDDETHGTTSIQYFYSTDGHHYTALTPFAEPFSISDTQGTSLYLKVRLQRSTLEQTPRLFNAALLFFDEDQAVDLSFGELALYGQEEGGSE